MKLSVSFDQALSSLPSGFASAVNYVVGYFDSLFANNVTVTINVGFGEIAGQKLLKDALGESEQINVPAVSYSAVHNALMNSGAAGSSTLPATSPAAGDTLYVPPAEEKALGLISNNSSIDGYVGFDSVAGTFSYAIDTIPPATQYDFVATLEHEITEIMGRASYLDVPGQNSIMDLYRYAGPNVRQLTSNGPSYFSVDNGQTSLDNWNNFQTGDNGDLGDWAASAGNDAFDDNANPGVINTLTQTDLTLMDALGWQVATLPTFFGAGALNPVYTPSGTNLPAAIAGHFNLEIVTAASGTNYPLPSGYQGVALLNTGPAPSINLVSGSLGMVDNVGGYSILAGSGGDSIGGAHGDTITGGTGNDFIDGSAGKESIIGGSAGSETIWGAAGDTISGGGAANETIGGVAFDIITGGTGTEFINGTGGNQSITGGSTGNETVWSASTDMINGGGAANETVGGVPGNTVIGGTGTEFIDGSQGNQSISGGSAGNETIWAGAGDVINGGTGGNVTIGGVPNDTITGGSAAAEFIDGSEGNQSITGGSSGNETIWGGAGDTINGGSGGNVLIGGAPGDTLTGANGTVLLDGWEGNQIVIGGSGIETIGGGAGDTITG
ncbi:MAG TPA: NF038122 family metalloprotease, partial [Stellaceae bacterium]|nr:NF038122 family metalloprotease [Stellaceae bacterium]